MGPWVPAPPNRVARRAFLLAGTTAGLAWLVGQGRGEPAASALGEVHAGPPRLRLPALTENGAKVPITVEMDHPMLAEHHVATVRVANDRDPIPGKGEFHFTPANGHAYLAFQARLDQGSSIVAVSAECTGGQHWSNTGTVQIAPGGGGCAGAAPAPDQAHAEIRPPVIRLPHRVRGHRLAPDELIDVQVKVKHPVRTGLALRGGQFVPMTTYSRQEKSLTKSGQGLESPRYLSPN